MGLGIGAVLPVAGSIRARDTGIEIISRYEANPGPLAPGLGIDNLNLDIEVVGLLHIGHGDLIIVVPFFPTPIEDVEAVIADRHDLPWSDGHAAFRPRV